MRPCGCVRFGDEGFPVSNESQLMLNVTIATGIALIGGLIAYRLRQSVIVGYLLAGMVIGPFTPGFIGDRAQIAALAEVGVIFLMFALGIEFSLTELSRVKGVAIFGTTLQVLCTVALGAGTGVLLGWPFIQSLFFGGVIAISSTMVILKTLIERGEVSSPHGRVLLGMLVVQDLAVVIMIVVLPKVSEGVGALDDLAFTVLRAVAFIGSTVFLGARVVPPLMARVERLGSPELFLLTAVTVALGAAAASAFVGLSPALGAFMGGLMLTETEFEHRVVAEIVPMRNLFATLFFVSVGMLINPAFVVQNLVAVVGLTLFIVVVKVVVTALAILPFRLGGKTTTFTSLGLLQIGEFSYVLAQAGVSTGAISESLNSLLLTSSLVTILLTPAAFWIAPRVDLALGRLPILKRVFAAQAIHTPPVDDLDGHAIVAGYGRVGQYVAVGLHRLGLNVSVIEQDLHLAREVRRAGLISIYGDASYRSVLEAARPERARLVVVALPDVGATRTVVLNARRANLTAPIVVRVAREDEDEVLRRSGATAVIAPERAGAILLLEESARLIDLPGSDAIDRPPLHTATATS